MIDAKGFIQELINNEINFFTGVPDSLMSEFSKSLHFDFKNKNHIIATNEGSALGICMGYNLATGKTPLIYMQNSGLGNFVNPYTSLLHKEIYNIPFLLLVGWRGEPGTTDEPQHIFQGKITLEMLKILEIEFLVIDSESDIKSIFDRIKISIKKNLPLALVVKKETFKKDDRKFEVNEGLATRKAALAKVISKFDEDALFISTTGKLSRELYELRKNSNQIPNDLYVVGGMGHASAISTGIASGIKNKSIVCLDGDGSILMQMGHLGIIGNSTNHNFYHFVFNNSAHESVGGQPTIFNDLDSKSLFKSFGYKNIFQISDLNDLDKISFSNISGPSIFEIKIQNSSDSNLMRPEKTPSENKNQFVKKINE